MPGNPWVMARLMAVVLRDIVLSNIQVARLILGPESRIRPGFVWIPLDIRNIYGITALASIITMTPGTLSCDLSEDRRYLLVHCLNLEDPAGTVAQIKQSYERPLMEIYPS
jgi:multicomponent K+:H+ antiporter subunit E